MTTSLERIRAMSAKPLDVAESPGLRFESKDFMSAVCTEGENRSSMIRLAFKKQCGDFVEDSHILNPFGSGSLRLLMVFDTDAGFDQFDRLSRLDKETEAGIKERVKILLSSECDLRSTNVPSLYTNWGFASEHSRYKREIPFQLGGKRLIEILKNFSAKIKEAEAGGGRFKIVCAQEEHRMLMLVLLSVLDNPKDFLVTEGQNLDLLKTDLRHVDLYKCSESFPDMINGTYYTLDAAYTEYKDLMTAIPGYEAAPKTNGISQYLCDCSKYGRDFVNTAIFAAFEEKMGRAMFRGEYKGLSEIREIRNSIFAPTMEPVAVVGDIANPAESELSSEIRGIILECSENLSSHAAASGGDSGKVVSEWLLPIFKSSSAPTITIVLREFCLAKDDRSKALRVLLETAAIIPELKQPLIDVVSGLKQNLEEWEEPANLKAAFEICREISGIKPEEGVDTRALIDHILNSGVANSRATASGAAIADFYDEGLRATLEWLSEKGVKDILIALCDREEDSTEALKLFIATATKIPAFKQYLPDLTNELIFALDETKLPNNLSVALNICLEIAETDQKNLENYILAFSLSQDRSATSSTSATNEFLKSLLEESRVEDVKTVFRKFCLGTEDRSKALESLLKTASSIPDLKKSLDDVAIDLVTKLEDGQIYGNLSAALEISSKVREEAAAAASLNPATTISTGIRRPAGSGLAAVRAMTSGVTRE